MLSVDDAIAKIIASTHAINDVESIAIEHALGYTLADDVNSTIDVPPADNSAMDGYAINVEDLASGEGKTKLPVIQIITAGSDAATLTAHTAARIFTGADIPEGANAVVMQEQCDIDQGSVAVPNHIPINNNIRPRGQDIRKGRKILNQGRVLRPQDLGLLASVGLSHINVRRPLTVAILSTGNELVTPGTDLKPGQIYNSNRYLLIGLLNKLKLRILDLGITKDNFNDTLDALKKAATADCIISTGGVSVGDEDHVKAAVDQLGEVNFWRIAVKPGKPLAFGHIEGKAFFGLPGNPVSAFLTFLLFVAPYLKSKQGQTNPAPQTQRLTANFTNKVNLKRQEYLRVNITGNQASLYPNQSSGVLSSVVYSDGLAIVPIGTQFKPGDSIEVLPFSQFI